MGWLKGMLLNKNTNIYIYNKNTQTFQSIYLLKEYHFTFTEFTGQYQALTNQDF